MSELTGPAGSVGRPILTTDRLTLREMTEADAAVFQRLRNDSLVNRHTHEEGIGDDIEVARELLRSYPDYRVHGYGRWGCVLRETGKLVGMCGLKWLEEYGEVDIGYRFVPETWGRGLATEAGLACLRHGFEEFRLASIIALVLPGNAGSIRVLEKLGLEHEGVETVDGLEAWRYRIRAPRDRA